MKTLTILTLLFYLTSTFAAGPDSKEARLQTNYPPCKACKIFIDSFKKAMEKTSRGKYEGGDAAWEEAKLKKYETSELRLTEIQEKVCRDLIEGQNQCFRLLDEFEMKVEDWWSLRPKSRPDLYEYLCIENFKYCCPENHFGEHCTPCHGYPDMVCSNNGRCRGNGTRKGNGTCMCNAGYTGEYCNACADTYFPSYKDSKKILCTKCHVACEGTCYKSGSKGCDKCAKGWMMDKDKECVDINECAASPQPCTPHEFCVNSAGSYKCLECDKSCLGCTGDGPDMCIRCASGYVLVDNKCLDAEFESRKQHVCLTRYLTYLGLCIATYIVFHKNTLIATVIGVTVALYISSSEYILNSAPTPSTEGIKEQILKALQ